MDTELARTFLMVAANGNFVAAASRLHVTQSTVSARIHTLETTLGVRLFQRGRNGAELTPAGKRFLRHAKHLVRTVEQARHDVGLPEGFHDVLTLSGRIAVWEGFLPHWVAWMRGAAPDVSLRLEIGFEPDIMQGLIEGTVDIGVMYTPTSRPGLVVEPLFDETLLLVTNDPTRPGRTQTISTSTGGRNSTPCSASIIPRWAPHPGCQYRLARRAAAAHLWRQRIFPAAAGAAPPRNRTAMARPAKPAVQIDGLHGVSARQRQCHAQKRPRRFAHPCARRVAAAPRTEHHSGSSSGYLDG